MKSQPHYQQVPLDEDDKQMLMTIFRVRMRFASLFYLFMISLVGSKTIKYIGFDNWFSKERVYSWKQLDDPLSNTGIQKVWICFWFLTIPILCAGTYYFRKKVWAYRKDVKTE